MGWVTERHGALYAREYGFDARFEALVARIVADFLDNFRPDRERCWIAEQAGQRLGSIFLVQKTSEVAQLRLLFLEPQARGLGLGRLLVDEVERFSRSVGYRKIVLWTQNVLAPARRLYEGSGYRLVGQEEHANFGPRIVGEMWEKELSNVTEP
jgi:GNAT superfamily N-acetyltransferase